MLNCSSATLILHVAKWIRQSNFRGPLSHCQSVMSEIIDDLEMMRSSFIKLPVTFPCTVWSRTIHRIMQTETGEQSQILCNVVKCTSYLKQCHIQSVSVYLLQCIFCTGKCPLSFYVCMCCSTYEKSTTRTDFLDTRTTYIQMFIHVHALFCIYLLYTLDGSSINFIPNSDRYCPLHPYTIATYFF